MNAFLFFRYGNRMLLNQGVQALKTEYKYRQCCTSLRQSDCQYFFMLAMNDNARSREYGGTYHDSFTL